MHEIEDRQASFFSERPTNLYSRAEQKEEERVANLLAERSNWLRSAEGGLLALLEACAAHHQQFDANIAVHEENLIKRVKLAFAGERRRAHEQRQTLCSPIQKQLGIVRRQLSELDSLTEKIVTDCYKLSIEECKHLLISKWPLPAEPPPAHVLREAWDSTCPMPCWTLTCDGPLRAMHDVESAVIRGELYDSWAPEWPASERAVFKGGTSLPMPSANSESSGPEDSCVEEQHDSARSKTSTHATFPQEQSLFSFFGECDVSNASEELVSRTMERQNKHTRSSRKTNIEKTKPWRSGQSDHGHSKSIHSKDLTGDWVKRWLDSNELHELIEIDAELEAIRKLEQKHAIGRAKRRLGLHH